MEQKVYQKMRKELISIFKKETQLTFAIKRERLNNGTEKLTPVVKEGGWFSQWTPIVRVNNTYQATDLYNDFQYTEKDCIRYINGYRDQVNKERENKIAEIKYEEVI